MARVWQGGIGGAVEGERRRMRTGRRIERDWVPAKDEEHQRNSSTRICTRELTSVDGDATEHSNERLDHLGERDELGISSGIVSLSGAGDVLDDPRKKLADAKMEHSGSSRSGGEERGEAVKSGGSNLFEGRGQPRA